MPTIDEILSQVTDDAKGDAKSADRPTPDRPLEEPTATPAQPSTPPIHSLHQAIQLLSKRRQSLSITQVDLAKRLAVTQCYISQLEHQVVNPSLTTLERWAKALGLSLEIRFTEIESGQ